MVGKPSEDSELKIIRLDFSDLHQVRAGDIDVKTLSDVTPLAHPELPAGLRGLVGDLGDGEDE